MKLSKVTHEHIEKAKNDENYKNQLLSEIIQDNQQLFNNIIYKFNMYNNQNGGYNQYNYNDLYSLALIALWNAVEKIDLEKAKEKNIKFITYAYKAIDNALKIEVKRENKDKKHNRSIEDFRKVNDTSDSEGDYYEFGFLDQIYNYNFEEDILAKIRLENLRNTLSDTEKIMYDCALNKKMKPSEIIDYVANIRKFSKSTAKAIYYNSFRKKVKENIDK